MSSTENEVPCECCADDGMPDPECLICDGLGRVLPAIVTRSAEQCEHFELTKCDNDGEGVFYWICAEPGCDFKTPDLNPDSLAWRLPAKVRPESKSSKERTHELKVWPVFFEALVTGIKPFEIRRNDRDYRAGDVLRLREWSLEGQGSYTGREVMRRVTYTTDWEQQTGFVVLGLAPETNADARDAERYRFLRRLDAAGIQVYHDQEDRSVFGDELDAVVDSARHAVKFNEPRELCPKCRGHQTSTDAGNIPCKTCGGTGYAQKSNDLRGEHPGSAQASTEYSRDRSGSEEDLALNTAGKSSLASPSEKIDGNQAGAAPSDADPSAPTPRGSLPNSLGDKCEHGIPRRFCTAVHGEEQPPFFDPTASPRPAARGICVTHSWGAPPGQDDLPCPYCTGALPTR